MIYGYSAEQIRAAEAPHLAAGEPLMQRASAGLAAEIRQQLLRKQAIRRRLADSQLEEDSGDARILPLVGSGDNGGDTLYAGAELAADGADVVIVTTGNRVHERGLAAAIGAGAYMVRADTGDLTAIAACVDVVVDGILGTGASADPALRGHAREIVASILPVFSAHSRPIVIAVDIPSGINPNDGSVPDPTVLPADVTVTFGGYKAGLLRTPASKLTGQLRLIDIGICPDLDKLEPAIQLPGMPTGSE